MYMESVALIHGKKRHKISVDIRIFLQGDLGSEHLVIRILIVTLFMCLIFNSQQIFGILRST